MITYLWLFRYRQIEQLCYKAVSNYKRCDSGILKAHHNTIPESSRHWTYKVYICKATLSLCTRSGLGVIPVFHPNSVVLVTSTCRTSKTYSFGIKSEVKFHLLHICSSSHVKLQLTAMSAPIYKISWCSCVVQQASRTQLQHFCCSLYVICGYL